MKDIIGHGGGGDSHTHYEATDSLHNTSYARVLDLVSEGEILGLANGLGSIYLNQTPLENADGSKNFSNVTVDFRTGTQDQDYIAGFPDVENEIAVGVELKSGTPWVHAINNTSLSAIRITLGVPMLSKQDTTNGDVLGHRVDYQIELSKDGGAYSTVISSSFKGKTTSEYQRSARIDLPPATTGWQVRVTRLTANANTAAIADTTRIVSYTEVIDAKLRYPMSAIVGIQLDASQFQNVPTRAYDLFGRIIQVPSNYDAINRTYTGAWDGTFKPSWSNNPAWVFRDLVLNGRYGLGNRITASQVDKWALYKIARYCDEMVPNGKGGTEPRFTCNLYLQSRKQAYAVLQDIASIFRGISYWGAGMIMASADMPADPIYVYTAANVIGGKFSRVGSKKATRYSVALVTWNDPEDFYRPKVEYVEDQEGIARYGIQQVELTAFGCTSQGQAQRAGRWALATSRLETEGITFDVGMDGAISLPGQIVRVADPSRMGKRVGGRVRTAAGRVVTLDKAPVINAGDKLTVILPAGTSETRTVSAVAGDSVTVDSDWSALPVAQSVWSVDSDELSAPLYRVLSVTEKDEVTFTITAVQHEPGKFAFVENGTAIVPRTQTSLDVTKQAPPAAVTLAGYTVTLNDVQKLALQVSCAPVSGAVAYEGAYRRGNDNWVAIPRQASPTMDVRDVLAGAYVAKMWAINSIGISSIETMSVAVEIAADGASKNASVQLAADAEFFHTNQEGEADPAVINFTADLTALSGPVTWSCVGGTLTNKTATTAQLTFANATAARAEVTASVTAFGRSYSKTVKIGKVQDGAAGTDGLKTAIARLFQWAPAAPAKPAGVSTFVWDTLANTDYTGTDGWAYPAPSNPGTPGWRLFAAAVPLAAAVAATTSPVEYVDAVIEDGAQNGATGASGVQSRDVIVYQWAVTIPEGPTGPATLKWADGSFGAAPANWTLTPGDAPSLGMTLFAASVRVADSAVNATTAFNWQSASIMAIGYVGTNGGKGDQGASYVTAYIASSAIAANGAPAQTTGRNSLPAANSSGLAGAWSAGVPALADGQRMYQTDGIYDPATNKVTWSIPYWSSLKVATLSAITLGVMGDITSGSLNIGNGKFTVDAAGNVTMRSFILFDPNTGKAILQAGGVVNPDFLPASVKNSELVPSINASTKRGAALNDDPMLENPAAWGLNSGIERHEYSTVPGARGRYFFSAGPGTGQDLYATSAESFPIDPTRTYNLSANLFVAAGNDRSMYVFVEFYDNAGNYIGSAATGWGGTLSGYVYGGKPPSGKFTLCGGDFGARTSRPIPANVASAYIGVWHRYSGDGVTSVEHASQEIRLVDITDAIRAQDAAQAYAEAQAEAARVSAAAHADGIVTESEARAIAAAQAKADAAKAAAIQAAAADATAKANIAATTANADGSIRTPAGTTLLSGVAHVDGAIKIRLPQSWTNTMMKFTVDIYEYSAGYACTLDISGYNYESGNWHNVTARVVGGSNVEYPVYFGHDGTKCCIWIGNANESWVYPQVQVRDFLAGFSNTSKTLWESGWSISFDTAAATYVSAAVTDTLPGADWSKIPNRAGRPQDNATVGAPAGTYVGGSPAQSVAEWAAAGANAYGQLPGMNAAITDKLSKTSASQLAATVTLATGGSLLAGTPDNGVYMTPAGLYCVQGGAVKVFIPISGDPTFAGKLMAAFGSFGKLTVANGGSLSTENFTGWVWPPDGSTGFYLGADGLMLGNPITGQWFKVSATGAVEGPGLDYKNGQLTLSNPVLVNPKTQTGFSASMSNLILNSQTNTSSYQTYSKSPTVSGGTAASYLWSLEMEEGDMRLSGDPTSSYATIQARGTNRLCAGWLTVTIRDTNGATATASCRVSIQFGSGAAI